MIMATDSNVSLFLWFCQDIPQDTLSIRRSRKGLSEPSDHGYWFAKRIVSEQMLNTTVIDYYYDSREALSTAIGHLERDFSVVSNNLEFHHDDHHDHPYPHQVSVLERMDDGLKVLECILPAYFKVQIVIIMIIMVIIVIITISTICYLLQRWNSRPSTP